ncbi:hypothetical protein C8R46DRAFT_1105314 [Mycena filopes]|nr:hypothetical protein C8R46DRAFT_1105314 [Mycena filopes]
MTQWTDDVGPSPSGATSGPRPSSVEETQQGGVEGDSDGTDPRISNSLYYEEIRSPQTQNGTFVSPQRPSRQMYTFEEGAYAHIHQLALQHRMSGNVHSLSLETGAVEEPEAFGNIGNTRVRSHINHFSEEIHSPQTQQRVSSVEEQSFYNGLLPGTPEMGTVHIHYGDSDSGPYTASESQGGAPSLAGLHVFASNPTPPGQYHLSSELYIAAMYDLLDQLGSVVGNIHSISDTFVVCDGINDDALFDVIILPGSKPGICFSQIPSGWDLSMVRNMDVFRRQALLPLLGNNPALRDAAYAHSRLVLALPQNISSLRVLKYSTSTSTGLRLLEPGNTTYQLQPHHAIESTYDDLQLNKCMTQQLVRENMDTLEAAMEEMCQNWLIALLGVVALLPYDQKHNMVEMHKQYMDCLAAMEQEAALQAGYTHSPMTWRSYQDMTTEFQFTVNLLMDSIYTTVSKENGSLQVPSPAQWRFAKTLGRLMAQWSPAPFFMNYVAQRRHQWYYFDVVAPLRQDFSSWAEPALVPNYLPRAIIVAVSLRRQQLEECRTKGTSPANFVLPLNGTPRVRGNGPLALKSTTVPEFSLSGLIV